MGNRRASHAKPPGTSSSISNLFQPAGHLKGVLPKSPDRETSRLATRRNPQIARIYQSPPSCHNLWRAVFRFGQHALKTAPVCLRLGMALLQTKRWGQILAVTGANWSPSKASGPGTGQVLTETRR